MLPSPLMGLAGMEKGNKCQTMYKVLYGSKSPFKFLKIKWAINGYENREIKINQLDLCPYIEFFYPKAENRPSFEDPLNICETMTFYYS